MNLSYFASSAFMNRDAQVIHSGVPIITHFLQLSAEYGAEDELGCTEYFVLPSNSRIRDALKFSGLFGVRESAVFCTTTERVNWRGIQKENIYENRHSHIIATRRSYQISKYSTGSSSDMN